MVLPPIRPFHCGTQHADWLCSNCERCARKGACEIETAVSEAAYGDGTVSRDIAKRMGCDPLGYVWQCTEWTPTEEWKREVLARRRWRNRAKAWRVGFGWWAKYWLTYPTDVWEKTRDYASMHYDDDSGARFGLRLGFGIARSICRRDLGLTTFVRSALERIAYKEATGKKD